MSEVAVGDWVGVTGSAPDGTARIAAVLPRGGVFRRTSTWKTPGEMGLAANIDTVFVSDALDGILGLRHLERFLALAWQSGTTPVVVVTQVVLYGPVARGDRGRGGGRGSGQGSNRDRRQFEDR